MSEKITQKEFAQRVGVSEPMVSKAIRSGRITRNPDGTLNWPEQLKVWEQNRAVHKDHQSRGIGQDGNIRQKYNEILAANKYWESKIRELRYKEMEGQVISKENIQKHLGPKLALIKTHIMTLPVRHSHTLAALLLRHVEKKSKNVKYIAGILNKIDEQQLAREIGNILDSDLRKLLKESAAVEHF